MTSSAATMPPDSPRVSCQESKAIGSLLVFSDDWGRHPSSCQHLIRNLVDRYPVLWVNTIGTRAPRLDLQTMKRVVEKLRQWGKKSRKPAAGDAQGHSVDECSDQNRDAVCPANLKAVNPKMWPWFGSDNDRSLNRWLLTKQLRPLIQQLPQPVVAITTLPITADLPNALPVDRWVYYCVDDFSQWPGLDGDTLRRMDRDMIRRADSLVAVSETLQSMISAEGRSATLLTHGVDVDFWRRLSGDSSFNQTPDLAPKQTEIVFWGVIDRRMDTPTLKHLAHQLPDSKITLIGPQQDPDPEILALPNVCALPAQPLTALPQIAQRANVLMMPYADLPVTRAMQPLKLKEYLATGKPVVVNQLPSTDSWADCMDVATTPDQFVGFVRERLQCGLPNAQAVARERLSLESWKSKARQLEHQLASGHSEAKQNQAKQNQPENKRSNLHCSDDETHS